MRRAGMTGRLRRPHTSRRCSARGDARRGKNPVAKRFRDSRVDCGACRMRPARTALNMRIGGSKLDESMILRPWLRYRPVMYFSVGYARYSTRNFARGECRREARGEGAGRPRTSRRAPLNCRAAAQACRRFRARYWRCTRAAAAPRATSTSRAGIDEPSRRN